MEPKTGKRIVSKGEYLRVLSMNVALGVGSIIATLLAFMSLLFAWWLEYTYQLDGAVLILIIYTFFLLWLAVKWLRQAVKEEAVVPLTRTNTADLPATDSLVRASSEPFQAQETVLLRAAAESVEKHEEQLVRASVGIEEQAEAFDIRWHSTLHSEKRFLFWKQSEAFLEFRFEILIAGHTIADQSNGDAVYWAGLAASKLSDGEYMIFTCSCGDMGCGGFSRVEVTHVEGRTLWYSQGEWNIFEEAVYKAAISRVESALVELADNHPGIPIKFVLNGLTIS